MSRRRGVWERSGHGRPRTTAPSTARAGTSAPPPTPPRPTTRRRASSPTRRSSATSSASTCRGSATSAGCAACTCSATSAPTRCRWRRLGARMTGLDFSGAVAGRGAPRSPPDAAPHVDFVESDVYDAARRARARRRSTSCSPASARCAGCRTSAAGPRSSPALLRPGGRLFIREGHPMLWALDEARDDGLLVVELPVLRARGADGLGRGRHLRRDRRRLRAQHAPTSGTTGSARSSPRCSTRAWSSPCSSSTTASRGTRCPARWSAVEQRRVPAADRPWRLPHTYTLQAVRR